MDDQKIQYPCGGFKELQQIPPGQILVDQHPCIFNEIQRANYVCPILEDNYPKVCQEVYKQISEQIAEAELMISKLEKKLEAEAKASKTLRERVTEKVTDMFHKKDDGGSSNQEGA